MQKHPLGPSGQHPTPEWDICTIDGHHCHVVHSLHSVHALSCTVVSSTMLYTDRLH